MATLVVAGIAAWSSYWHGAHMAIRHGERPEVAYAMPVSVDGMLVVASLVMMQDRRARRRIRGSARLAMVVGVAASIAANVDGAYPDTTSRAVAAWPAVALLLVVEMLTRPGRARTPETSDGVDSTQHLPEAAPPTGIHIPASAPRPAPIPHATATAHVRTAHPSADHATTTTAPTPTPPQPGPLSRRGPSARRRTTTPPPAETPKAGKPHVPQQATDVARPDGRGRPAAETYALARQVLAADPTLTRAALAARVGVTPRRLRAVFALMDSTREPS